jgi:hypothetical protein
VAKIVERGGQLRKSSKDTAGDLWRFLAAPFFFFFPALMNTRPAVTQGRMAASFAGCFQEQ